MDSGTALVSKRIEVEGKGKGTVVEVKVAKGKSTEHIVEFDDGRREAVLLSKDPAAPSSKGCKFWLLNDVVQARTTPSRSQC